MHSHRRIALALVTLVVIAAGCSETEQTTAVRAVVAPNFSHEGLASGDPVAGATLRLYQNDTEVLEATFDNAGTVVIAPEQGIYDLQIEAASSDPACFWGETIFDMTLPSRPITVEVGFICAGG